MNCSNRSTKKCQMSNVMSLRWMSLYIKIERGLVEVGGVRENLFVIGRFVSC